MGILLLGFVRSIRIGDFGSLDEIADWAFILDHYHYARLTSCSCAGYAESADKTPASLQ